MGRPKRADETGCIYHMLNRANRRDKLFFKDADYEAFERVLTEAVARHQLDLFCFCIMPNHWHLCVRPRVDGEMSRFAQWLTLTHTQRYNAHYDTVGYGHLYQGRYKSFPVQDDEHFLTVCRYVERNALAAQLCETPDAWRFGSLHRWKHGTAKEKSLLTTWPIPRHRDWIGCVTMALTDKEIQRLHWSKTRGCPFGEETWVESVARRFDLEMTMRPRGRPRKFPNPQKTT
jgi:putative transposase